KLNTNRHDMALTALASMCFLAANHTPALPGEYHSTITRAIDFLVDHQKPNGDLRGEGGNMYDQGITTLALAEAAIMTGNPTYKQAAVAGIHFIRAAQDTQSGGWRYLPGQ